MLSWRSRSICGEIGIICGGTGTLGLEKAGKKSDYIYIDGGCRCTSNMRVACPDYATVDSNVSSLEGTQ